MKFSLYGRYGEALAEGVETFMYIGRPLDQTEDAWLVVRQNIKWEWKVWGRLGKLLRREGVDNRVAEILDRAVKQVVIIFGLNTWVLSAVMDSTADGTNTGFLRHLTREWVQWKADRMWVTPREEV